MGGQPQGRRHIQQATATVDGSCVKGQSDAMVHQPCKKSLNGGIFCQESNSMWGESQYDG
jgi:hypothetical protein